MRLPFFASSILFFIWLAYTIRRIRFQEEKREKSFWEKERLANSVRKKSLDGLSYITIPFEKLPITTLNDDETVKDCLDTLQTLSTQKIVNLTGITNTDLKLQYGAPNITFLMEYDQNFTLLARTLEEWAARLYDNEYFNEAKAVLEFAISVRSDISASYKKLAHIYTLEMKYEKIEELVQIASTLNSAMKDPIVRMLKEAGPYTG